ncbi:ser/thr kinase-like protein [Variola virus]|uniref:Ser/thr kinase-like protein n=1 Tax=Variola virus TaxID=10255 RepID=Q0NE51_VARV|nr:ser/thr kinase-like protein [Variola virus]
MIEWFSGKLPWKNKSSIAIQQKREYKKFIATFFEDCFPEGNKPLELVYTLDYSQTPNYERLRRLDCLYKIEIIFFCIERVMLRISNNIRLSLTLHDQIDYYGYLQGNRIFYERRECIHFSSDNLVSIDNTVLWS